MGRGAECTAYLRLLQDSWEDTDFTMHNMMSCNQAQETNRYCSHAIHMYLVVLEGCHKPKVTVMCPFLSCITFPVYQPCYIYLVSRCCVVSCTIHLTYIMCLRTL